MKINIFKKENNFKKKDFTFLPNLYWEIIFISTVVIIFLSFLFGYYLFVRTNQESVFPSTNNDELSGIVNKDRIEKVLNYFSEREKRSNQILNSPAPVVDPSL